MISESIKQKPKLRVSLELRIFLLIHKMDMSGCWLCISTKYYSDYKLVQIEIIIIIVEC